MPVGLLDDDEFEREMARLTKKNKPTVETENRVPSVEPLVTIIDKPSRGRQPGDNNVPDSLRQIIGETSVIDGRRAALKLASEFGISPSSVSAYANGATSTTTYDTPSKSIISHIKKSRQRAISKASKTLNGALSAITQEKLDYSDAKDLSGIAKDMSVIIRNLEPPAEGPQSHESQAQFVIFAPTFRDERSFGEMIHVKE